MQATGWFESNYVKLNQERCHKKFFWKLLGIIIDRNLRFDEYTWIDAKRLVEN